MAKSTAKQAHNRLREAVLDGESAYPKKLKVERYEARLQALQIQLLKLQHWVQETGERVCVLFEGRDAAGKGGAISRFAENLNPRGTRVVALAKPSDVERGQWYFQRYVAQLPSSGEIVLFDRSWYNRAVVERVMDFCTPHQYGLFVEQVVPFERMLVDDGIHLIKLWFAVGREEQKKRFADRRKNPLKRWKLSPVDAVALERYDHYTEALVDMLIVSDREKTPWTIVNGNEKRRARLGAIGHVLSRIPYEGRDDKLVASDPAVVAAASALFDRDALRFKR